MVVVAPVKLPFDPPLAEPNPLFIPPLLVPPPLPDPFK